MPGEIPGTSVIQAHFDHILENSSISIYWKDKKGVYLGFNNYFLKMTRRDMESDVVGTKDFDQDWKKYAHMLWRNDSEVICTGKYLTALEFGKVCGEIQYYSTHKIPLRSRTGKIIGVFGQSIPLGKKTVSVTRPEELKIDSALLFRGNPSNYIKLSSQELTCTRLAAGGFSAKEIAKILDISPRTVETYLNQAKSKFGAKNIKQLITNFIEESPAFKTGDSFR